MAELSRGVSFVEHRDAGDPVKLASAYDEQGADELVLLDISASHENRNILLDVVKRTAEELFIPFMVGGGIRNLQDIREILFNGADKISINTAAVKEPHLILEASEMFGSQCIVSSIDVKRVYLNDEDEATGRVVLSTPQGKCWWEVFIYGGLQSTGVDAIQWAQMAVELGAGEIMASSLDFDGTNKDMIMHFSGLFLKKSMFQS